MQLDAQHGCLNRIEPHDRPLDGSVAWPVPHPISRIRPCGAMPDKLTTSSKRGSGYPGLAWS
jgi:hypothetical protein